MFCFFGHVFFFSPNGWNICGNVIEHARRDRVGSCVFSRTRRASTTSLSSLLGLEFHQSRKPVTTRKRRGMKAPYLARSSAACVRLERRRFSFIRDGAIFFIKPGFVGIGYEGNERAAVWSWLGRGASDALDALLLLRPQNHRRVRCEESGRACSAIVARRVCIVVANEWCLSFMRENGECLFWRRWRLSVFVF